MISKRLSHTLFEEVGFSLLAEGKTIRVKADGYSMYPVMKPGSVIFIHPLNSNETPSGGEIIALKKDFGLVVHRCIRTFEDEGEKYIVTRGDSHLEEDLPEPFSSIAGRVIRVELPSGRILNEELLFIKNPNYRLNRLLVRIILQISRLNRRLTRERAAKER